MRVLLAVILFVAVTFAGCANGPSHGVGDQMAPLLPLDTLSEAVFDVLPVEELFVTASDGTRMHNAVFRPDTNETVPVFINFSPYWGNTAEAGGDGFGQYLIEHLVPRGYAVVLSAVRGTGHSEGCFEVASDREVEDLYDVVDFFANEAWSTGAVAAGGKSYDSTTQNGLIAKMPHPALKGLFHVSGITDMYRYNYVNGVPYANGLTFTPRYAEQYSLDGEHPDGQAQNLIDMACPEMAEHVVSGTGSAAHGMKDAYWQERDWTQFIGDSDWNGSIFFVHGFQDWNVKPDHILPWIDNLPEQVRVKGWLHQDTDNGGHVYPMRADWNETMIAWLDNELKGKHMGFWDAPAWDVEGTDGLWREMDAWPPEVVEVPVELVGSAGGPTSKLTVRPDPHGLGLADADGNVRISGTLRLEVLAGINNPDAVLTAVIALNDQWVGEAVLRAVFRDGLAMPAPANPAFSEWVTLESYPLDIVVGQDDVLEVRFGQMPRHALTTQGHVDGAAYSGTPTVWLPVAAASARPDQPVATSCFAC